MISPKPTIPLLILMILLSVISACGSQAEPAASEDPVEQPAEAAAPTQESTAAVEEPVPMSPAPASPALTIMPGDPPEPIRTLEDSASHFSAADHKATQGDNMLNGLYERPFTSVEMVYQPDLDIISVDFAPGESFFYFTIRLYAMNNQGGGLKGQYAIEFDRSKSGRGDLLVLAENPGKEWSSENVTIYADNNRDVGGPKPVIADEGFKGSGYDTTLEMDGDKAAFARLDPADANAVQIAVSYALLENPEEFLRGAWADNGLRDPAQYDYNDRMGPTAAGSPILGDYYPVKELYNLDNTCRLPYGFDQDYAGIPGICISAPPITVKQDGGCTPYCIRQCTTHVGCCEWGYR